MDTTVTATNSIISCQFIQLSTHSQWCLTVSSKQQGLKVVDAQLRTGDIIAKLGHIEQARVYRVPTVWLLDAASKDCGVVRVPTALYQLLLCE